MHNSPTLELIDSYKLTPGERNSILEITDASFADRKLERDIITCYHFNSSSSFVILSRIAGNICSYIFLVQTELTLDSSPTPAVSIGPIATHPNYRRRGLLRAGLNLLQIRFIGTANIVYLQGAAGIYNSLGFKTFARKSKIEVRYVSPCIPFSSHRLRPSRFSPFEAYQILQSAREHDRSIISNRSISFYENLINYGSGCVLFHAPHGLRLGTELVAYFTLDPYKSSIVREIVISSPKYTNSVLRYIANLMDGPFEIYTSKHSSLSQSCLLYTNCIRSEAFYVDGGNMYKSLGMENLDKVSQSTSFFMLQGDNL